MRRSTAAGQRSPSAGRPVLHGSIGRAAWRLFEPYPGLLIVVGILVGWAAVAAAAARFVLVHRRGPDPQEERIESRLPPYPVDPSSEALVIGEQRTVCPLRARAR